MELLQFPIGKQHSNFEGPLDSFLAYCRTQNHTHELRVNITCPYIDHNLSRIYAEIIVVPVLMGLCAVGNESFISRKRTKISELYYPKSEQLFQAPITPGIYHHDTINPRTQLEDALEELLYVALDRFNFQAGSLKTHYNPYKAPMAELLTIISL